VIDAPSAVATRARARLRPRSTAVVAVAGPVAVGKSTLAADVADALRAEGATAEVVSTDGFLYSSAELSVRGLVARKGFPESYDVDALRRFLAAVRDAVDRAHEVTVPVYSHETYDIVPGERRPIPPSDVLVLEGLNALYATTGLVDLGVYVDAPLPVIEDWYVVRFLRLCDAAGPGSFYSQFVGMDRSALEHAALDVYRSINLPNLVEFIGPSRSLADVVVEKRPDHAVGEVIDVARP
jgi:type I pantothenate kinase